MHLLFFKILVIPPVLTSDLKAIAKFIKLNIEISYFANSMEKQAEKRNLISMNFFDISSYYFIGVFSMWNIC